MPASSAESDRPPVVAGQFYPDDPDTCLREARQMLQSAPDHDSASPYLGALLPHAGWICSGQVAANGIAALRRSHPKPNVIVIFGAVHTLSINHAALDDHARWLLPSGTSDIATALVERLASASDDISVDSRAHRYEHAIEVLLPMVQQAWPHTPILPIEGPPTPNAADIGRQVATALQETNQQALFIASSDLTHYGPSYHLTSAGAGQRGIAWAMDNDRRLLDLIQALQAGQIVPETLRHSNACGGGAIAAMLGASIALGATKSTLLEHTNSYEVLSRALGRQSADNSVGYAAALIG